MPDFKNIDHLKNQLDQKRPLPSAAVQNLREVFRVDWTYNSNAIEGNTLSLVETKVVLEEGLTVGGKTLREHFEAINHSEAILYVEECVQRNAELSEKVIKDIHGLILKNIDRKNAGRYRNINVRISGSEHKPVDFMQVQNEIRTLLEWYDTYKNRLHPIKLAALFHFKFVYIHPFTDGNGRTTRLLMNFILMSRGYPPAIIKAKQERRLEYYKLLEEASLDGKTEPFVEFVADSVEESLLRYLETVE